MRTTLRRHVAGLTLLGALASSVTPALADEVVVTEAAREKFRAGVALLKDPDGARYEDAYLAFKAAYAISPSPNMLGNVGLCALKLERDGEAIDAYTTYLAKGTDIPEDERKQIERDLATMKSTLATLVLDVAPAGASVVDERQRTSGASQRNKYGPLTAGVNELRLRAGTHRLTVSVEGHVDQTVELELAPGQSVTKKVELKKAGQPDVGGAGGDPGPRPGPGPGPQPELERPVPVSVWVTLGLTGALGVSAGVVGGLALANKGEFDDVNDGSDPVAAEEVRDEGQVLNITTDVLIGATGAAAAVTLILFLTRPEVPVTVAPTGTGLVVLGRF